MQPDLNPTGTVWLERLHGDRKHSCRILCYESGCRSEIVTGSAAAETLDATVQDGVRAV